ncbi:MAG: hypothetical protein SNJ85_03595 [Cyanobacteriota bacterium]
MSKFQVLAMGGTSLVLMASTLIGCQQAKDKNVTSFLPGPIIGVQNPTVETGGTNVGSSPVAVAQPTPGIPQPVSAPTIDPVVTPDAVPPIVAEKPVPPAPIPPVLTVSILPGREQINVVIPVGTGTGPGAGLIAGTANVNAIVARITGGVAPITVDVQIDPTPFPPFITNPNGTFTASFSFSVINNQVFINAAFIFPGTYDLQISATDSTGQLAVGNITIVVTQGTQ